MLGFILIKQYALVNALKLIFLVNCQRVGSQVDSFIRSNDEEKSFDRQLMQRYKQSEVSFEGPHK